MSEGKSLMHPEDTDVDESGAESVLGASVYKNDGAPIH